MLLLIVQKVVELIQICIPNTTDAEVSDSHPKIITDGIQVSQGLYDNNNVNFVVWNWKANGGTTSSNTNGTITSTVQANTESGFSVVLFTGNGTSGATVGHGLSSPLDMLNSEKQR